MPVHASARVARGEIAAVEGELFLGPLGGTHAHVHMGIARQAAPLAAVGLEARDRNAHGDAGAALRAMRSVDDVAGAAEAPAQRERIPLPHARVARIEDEIARDTLGPVATRVFGGLEQLEVVCVLAGVGAHAGSIAPSHAAVAFTG